MPVVQPIAPQCGACKRVQLRARGALREDGAVESDVALHVGSVCVCVGGGMSAYTTRVGFVCKCEGPEAPSGKVTISSVPGLCVTDIVCLDCVQQI